MLYVEFRAKRKNYCEDRGFLILSAAKRFVVFPPLLGFGVLEHRACILFRRWARKPPSLVKIWRAGAVVAAGVAVSVAR